MPVRITDESALIVWDAKSGTEQFVRRAHFETKSKDFGFFVPTPSRPTLGEVPDNVFKRLEVELQPKVEHRDRISDEWSFFLARTRIKNTFNAAADSLNVDEDDNVSVIEGKRIGDYNATVLKANDATTLKVWLRSHHYTATSNFEEWASPYIQKGWYLTAFKIASDVKRTYATAKAVALTFKAEAPFYPYRESKRAQQMKGARTLRLFYIGNDRPDARIKDDNYAQLWPAQTDYSATLSASSLAENHLTLPSGPLRLTAFTDASHPRPGWADLVFASADDQNEKTPPPHIIWHDRTVYIPLDAIAFVLAVATAFCWDLHLKRAKKARKSVEAM